ncbi:hypothetical protein C7E17_25570, partial [Stenotrophomonas maltophilia]
LPSTDEAMPARCAGTLLRMAVDATEMAEPMPKLRLPSIGHRQQATELHRTLPSTDEAMPARCAGTLLRMAVDATEMAEPMPK